MFHFTFAGGKIAEIELFADAERLDRLDLVTAPLIGNLKEQP